MTNSVVWAGRYAVFDEIASGGMASVFLACRLGPGDTPRVVAVKKLFEQFAKQPEFVTMFLDEAHLATRIRHPNVVATYEFLRVPDSLAIVMEFVLGTSLEVLSRIGRDRAQVAPLGVTAAILRDALAGLHAAHEGQSDSGAALGLVHRDVSPHNILVGKDGAARVIDFGIAKAAGRLQVTEAGIMKGKFAYMAPEQIRAGQVDRRTDVYAAGVVLWEALTGQSLFEGPSEAENFGKRAEGTAFVPSPTSINRALPPALDDVLRRALAFEPGDRFATARDMAEALTSAVEPAPPADVTTWVEELAGSRLRELEAKRTGVEVAYASGALAGHAPPSAVSRPHENPAAAPSTPEPPDLVLPGTANVVPLDLDLADAMIGPGPSRPLLARSRRAAADGPGARRPRRANRASPALLGVFVLAAVAAVAALRVLPPRVRTRVIAAAAERGYDMAVDRVELRRSGLTLVDATISPAGVADLTLKAPAVAVLLDWRAQVRGVAILGFDLSVRGDVKAVGGRLSRWRAEHHEPTPFEASAGHLLWSDAVLPGVPAEGLDVSISAGPGGDGALRLDVPSLSVVLPGGALGPWRARLDAAADETRVALTLDRSRPEGPPNLDFVTRAGRGGSLSATIPRTKTSLIGVPAELLHAGLDPEVDLALEARSMGAGTPLSAHARLGLFATAAPGLTGGSEAVDLLVEANILGDPSVPLRIEGGSLTVGKARSRLTGVVTVTGSGARVEVDRPSSKASPPRAPLILDTREWTDRGPPAPPAGAPPAGGRR